jgi:hypothetical protein
MNSQSQTTDERLTEEYQLSVKLSEQAAELQNKIATLLLLERGKLEGIAFNLTVADFFREDALRRIAEVNEALASSYTVFNTIQSQLTYLFPLVAQQTPEAAPATTAVISIPNELIN